MNLLDQVDVVMAEHKILNWKIGVMAGANPDSTLQNKNNSFHRWRDKLAQGVVDLEVLKKTRTRVRASEGRDHAKTSREQCGDSESQSKAVRPALWCRFCGEVGMARGRGGRMASLFIPQGSQKTNLRGASGRRLHGSHARRWGFGVCGHSVGSRPHQ